MSQTKDAFQRAGAESRQSLVSEFWSFLKANGKWWLLPILVCMALMAALVLLAGSGAAPFIYTVF